MVDLKKINIPKVKVDPGKVMGLLDGIVAKIPPQVQDLLRKIAITLFVCLLLFGIYSGWTKGWEAAKPQGLQLAQDTRSLFLEEIERDYNRNRKDVQMTSPEDIDFGTQRKMEFTFTTERARDPRQKSPLPEADGFLGEELDFRNKKSSGETPPLMTPNGDGLISSPQDFELLGTYQESRALQETSGVEPPLLDRKNPIKNPIPALPDDASPEDKKRFRAMVDRLDILEKKVAEKKKKEEEAKLAKERKTENLEVPKRSLEKPPAW